MKRLNVLITWGHTMHTQEPKQIPNPKWRRRTLARAVAALLASMAVAVSPTTAATVKLASRS